MASDPSRNKKVIAAVVAGVAVSIGGYALFNSRRKAAKAKERERQTAQLLSQKVKQASSRSQQAPVAPPQPAAQPEASRPAAPASTAAETAGEVVRAALEQALQKTPTPSTAPVAAAPAQPESNVAVTPGEIADEDGHFPELGLTFKTLGRYSPELDQDGKSVAFSYPVAMLRLKHENSETDYISVTVIIEDITKEFMTEDEYLEKTKKGVTESDFTSNMMIPKEFLPKVTELSKVECGEFTSVLGYIQSIPSEAGIMQLMFKGHITVRNGFAYAIQLAGRSNIFSKYVKEFEDLVKGITIGSVARTNLAVQTFASSKHGVQVSFPLYWIPTKMYKEGPNKDLAVSLVFNTFGEVKKDTVYVRLSSKRGDALVAEYTKSGPATPVNGVADAVSVCKSGEAIYIFTESGVVLQVEAKDETVQTVNENVIAGIRRSIKPYGGEHGEYSVRVESPELAVSFAREIGWACMEMKLGDPTLQMNLKEDAQIPNLAITRPSPDLEKEPPTDLKQWWSKLDKELTSESITLESKEYGKIGNVDCIFATAKEMCPVSFTEFEERTSKMAVVLHKGQTVVIRFESVSGEFAQYRNKLAAFFNSFEWQE